MTRIDPIERHLFLEGVFLRYGYDFRGYSEASLNRRLGAIMATRSETSLLDVLKVVLSSPQVFREVLPLLTIGTTEFFRDPLYFKALRERVVPLLRTYPSLTVWIAGCSTGEEIISLAILLKEDGLLDRTTIFATDINPEVIKHAKEGIYNLHSIQSFAKNYSLASGLHSPSSYYTADYGLVRFDPELLANVVFTEHNLATDAAFVEAHLILCRNVMIYFSKSLQEKVYDLFTHSLVHRGFLGIGTKESIRFSKVDPLFEKIDTHQNLFQLKANAQSLRESSK